MSIDLFSVVAAMCPKWCFRAGLLFPAALLVLTVVVLAIFVKRYSYGGNKVSS
jgi:hypothetical protein